MYDLYDISYFSMKKPKDKLGHDKLYGTATVGARGQVAIPAEARKDFGISPGDQILVMGKFGKLLGMIKLDELQSFLEEFSERLDRLDEESKKTLGKSRKLVKKFLKKQITKESPTI